MEQPRYTVWGRLPGREWYVVEQGLTEAQAYEVIGRAYVLARRHRAIDPAEFGQEWHLLPEDPAR